MLSKRWAGFNPRVPVHDVSLSAPGWRDPIVVHSALTRGSAARAAARIGQHIGVEPSEISAPAVRARA